MKMSTTKSTAFAAARVRAGLTIRQAATICGVSRQTVERWQAGKSRVPALAMKAILAHGS